MRLPSVPGPFDVLHAVTDLRDGVAEALALVPRLGAALGRMEGYLDRVGGLLDRVDGVVDRADEAIASVATTQEKADAAIEGVDRTQSKADEAIERVGRTTSHADRIIDHAEGLLGRVDPLLGDYEPALISLAPSVRRLASTLDPAEVEAMVTLVDRLPRLIRHLDEDILPVLESLGDVGTDVHDLVDTVQDLRQVVKGFPGSRLFRRRGAEEIALEDAREAAAD
jgi:ABC-type transporter Mla subunit MlaD